MIQSYNQKVHPLSSLWWTTNEILHLIIIHWEKAKPEYGNTVKDYSSTFHALIAWNVAELTFTTSIGVDRVCSSQVPLILQRLSCSQLDVSRFFKLHHLWLKILLQLWLDGYQAYKQPLGHLEFVKYLCLLCVCFFFLSLLCLHGQMWDALVPQIKVRTAVKLCGRLTSRCSWPQFGAFCLKSSFCVNHLSQFTLHGRPELLKIKT